MSKTLQPTVLTWDVTVSGRHYSTKEGFVIKKFGTYWTLLYGGTVIYQYFTRLGTAKKVAQLIHNDNVA